VPVVQYLQPEAALLQAFQAISERGACAPGATDTPMQASGSGAWTQTNGYGLRPL
jgi:hypothetical protein